MLGFSSVIVTRNFTELEGLTKEREGKHVIKLPGRFTLFSSVGIDTLDPDTFHFLLIIHPPGHWTN